MSYKLSELYVGTKNMLMDIIGKLSSAEEIKSGLSCISR